MSHDEVVEPPSGGNDGQYEKRGGGWLFVGSPRPPGRRLLRALFGSRLRVGAVALSVLMVATVVHVLVFPRAAEPMTARDLPLLTTQDVEHGADTTKIAPEPAAPPVDFGPLRADSSGFDQASAAETKRSERSVEYTDGDGTKSVVLSPTPISAPDGVGGWIPVDTRVVPEPDSRRASARSGAEVSFAESADAPAPVRIERDGAGVTLALEGADNSRREVTESTVTYRDVLPGVDLAYEVTPGSVKESLVLGSASAIADGRWVFRLDADGLTPRPSGDSIEFTDGTGAVVAVLPPIEAFDKAGARTGGTYSLDRVQDSWRLTVTVDRAWLSAADRRFPVVVDPTYTYGFGGQVQAIAYKQGAAACTDTCGVRTGVKRPLFQTPEYWRSALQFDLSSLFGRSITGARLEVKDNSSTPWMITTSQVKVQKATVPLGYGALGDLLASASVGATGTLQSSALTTFFADRVAASDAQAWFMLAGEETGTTDTYKDLSVSLVVDYVDTPQTLPDATLVTPADDAVVATVMPTLQVATTGVVPDGTKYCFKVSTGFDGRSGSVAQSGCLTEPKWIVPRHVLQDGSRYTWTVDLSIPGVPALRPAPWLGHFTVDERNGDPGPTPTDTLGPVTVNMFNGNLRYNAAGPAFDALGGSAAIDFAYNSRTAGVAQGVRATYFNDTDHNGAPDGPAVLVRSEPQVALNHWTQNIPGAQQYPLPAGLKDNWYVVRWEGQLQAPTTGTYKFGGTHTDGAKIWINDQLVYDNPVSNTGALDFENAASTPIALTAGQRLPLKVELYHHTDTQGSMVMWAQPGNPVSTIVPTSWLYPADPPSLPSGWSMSMPASDYTSAELRDGSIVLTDGAAGKHTWAQTTGGGYIPPPGRDGVVALDADGRISVTEDGVVSVFNADGTLAEVSTVVDTKKPASLRYLYSGSPSRLTEIRDPVSGRSHILHYNTDGTNGCYGGATIPQGAETPPKHQLCRITYWDGTQTLLWYSLTILARIENPGGAIQDFNYRDYAEVKEALKDATTEAARRSLKESIGPLSTIRSPFANDWAAYQNFQGTQITTISTAISYTPFTEEVGQPQRLRVTGVAGPAEDGRYTGEQIWHRYGYDLANKRSTVDVNAIGALNSAERTVTWDASGRLLTSTDAVGDVTRTEWNAKDNRTASVDTTGRRSTVIYDHADRVTDSYGPAPSACFDGQLPKPECAATTPHSRTDYDENMVGLEAAFYGNPYLSGVPKEWRTGVGSVDGSLNRTWGATPPVPGTGWSGRFTGEIEFPAVGQYGLGFTVVDGVRLWIDERLIVDSWTDKAATAVTGTYTNAVAGSKHRIRVDYYNRGGSTGALNFTWTPPGTATATVPGQYLRPRYGLVTSQITENTVTARAPEKKTATGYSDPTNGIDPALGVTVSRTGDPGGLGLTSRMQVESPGQGYLRQVAAALPAGDLTDVDKRATSTFYGDSETRANPCNTNAPPANQAGRIKTARGPKNSDNVATAVESVYDAAGRIVAVRTDSEPWSCTTYDARGRVTQRSHPAMGAKPARVIGYVYAVNGDPRQHRTTDASGSTTTVVDLAGQIVSYTDANGNVTTSDYDAAGRKTREATTVKTKISISTYQWDNASRLTRVDLDGVTVATPTYNAGVLQSVAYGNTSNLTIGRNDAASVNALTWQVSGSTVVSGVTRSRDQRIIDARITDSATPGTTFDSSYTYDGVGRLVAATVPFHQLTYAFAPSNGCGPNTKAGLNTNRTSSTDSFNGAPAVTTNYCYDHADRLLSTNGGTALSFTYDAYGNAITVGTDTLGYDSTLRHMSTTTAAGTSINYVRDVNDRIIGRTANANPAQATRYGFVSDGAGPEFVLDGSGNLRQRLLKLPGGVLLTKTYDQTPVTNWSYPNIHGDILFTANGNATRTGTLHLYDPYGQNIDPATGVIGDIPIPATAEGGLDFGWLGQNTVPVEHLAGRQALEMGARTYLPVLGRFLQGDPIPGASANAYDYVNGDPVNTFDLTGKAPGGGKPGGGKPGGGKPGGDGVVSEDIWDLYDPQPTGEWNKPQTAKPLLTDEAWGKLWDHIKERHKPGVKDPRAGVFSGKEKEVRKLVADTIRLATGRPNTPDENGNPRPGKVYDWDFGRVVGHAGPAEGGGELTAVRVVVDEEGKFKTAHPI
ncbi:PA14 domain-containing protein [Nocardia takedensis]|uniref:PA14 domain-containing protein n=1 Tax=Nocardia takedensis TaxID=259390 RepID=UPI0002FA4240|nr:PA14 domain-containing protein [Nocardia takedensis]